MGGENLIGVAADLSAQGSSPRGRGKPKQAAYRRASSLAHPRVGGENGVAVIWAQGDAGSSPRGRGKHFLTCAFIERIGQILETLELAVSSESYTLSAAYATDAPQDQARNTALVLPSSRAAS